MSEKILVDKVINKNAKITDRLLSPCCNAPVCLDSEVYAESLALKCKACEKPLPVNW